VFSIKNTSVLQAELKDTSATVYGKTYLPEKSRKSEENHAQTPRHKSRFFGGAAKNVKHFFVIPAVIFIIASTTAAFLIPLNLAGGNKESPLFLGVAFCGNTAAEAKLLIDKVKPYTNLFVLQSFPISRNETAIYETLDYATNQGLNIIVNLCSSSNQSDWYWQFEIFKNAKQRWGEQFLGAYYNDEPGGFQLDYNWTPVLKQMENYNWSADPRISAPENKPPMLYYEYLKIRDAQVNGTKPQDYDLEAQVFLDYFKIDKGYTDLKTAGIKTFVSDYALYWFDYLAGYDVVLAQFGSNSSYIQNIDLVRGAARMQNKEWGAILTWKYSEPPYLDTGEEIHQQMLAACEAGAKYIIIFDYPQMEGNPYGVMQEEHFQALERFANDVMATAKMRTLSDESKADAVLVLPRNYGWGMRRPDDIIWGYWEPDGKSAQVWSTLQRLLVRHGVGLDIVYDDPAFPVADKYAQVYYWNQTL
jgi:hypothetical protein